jgi:glucan 1,3-beta-glucosidase
MFEKTGNDGIIDEYTFGQYQDRSTAEALLHEHWSTWYTEQDFIDIANVGLNHVRYVIQFLSGLELILCSIPMSYWCVPMSQDTGPYIPGAWPYVLQALDWARAHGLYVIFDLHGAPGSQNGFDNSGQRTPDPYWGLDQSSIDRTVEVLGVIASEVGDKVSIIQLLNEVAGFRSDQWASAARGFWQAAYDKVRANGGNDVKVMIGDAFLGVGNWDGYMKTAHNVIMDLVRTIMKGYTIT